MALKNVSGIISQFENYPNWWLKAYEQGTTTPLSMALDRDGATTVAKLEINSSGFPESAGGALVVPWIESAYDMWLFPTEAEADANDTSNALQFADNIGLPAMRVDMVNIDDYVTNELLASAEINAAADQARLDGVGLMSTDPSKTYKLDARIDLRNIKYISFVCDFDTSLIDIGGAVSTESRNGQPSYYDDCCIWLGGFAQSSLGYYEFHGSVISDNDSGYSVSALRPQIQVNGAKNGRMVFNNVGYLRFYAEYNSTKGTYSPYVGVYSDYNSIAYNEVYVNGVIKKFEIDSDQRFFTLNGSGVGSDPALSEIECWINENRFYGGRWVKIAIRDKGYVHNHNKWVFPTMEGGSEVEIELEIGDSNSWEGCRFEGVSQADAIVFSGTSSVNFPASNNIIARSWVSSLTPRETVQQWDAFNGILNDQGINNMVHYEFLEKYQKHEVINFNPNIPIVTDGLTANNKSSSSLAKVLGRELVPNTFANQRPVVPGGHSVVFPSAYTKVAESGLIPVSYGDIFSTQVEWVQGFWRWYIVCYDANGVPLADSAAISSPQLSYGGVDPGLWSTVDRTIPTGVDNDTAHIASTDVAFVSIVISSGSTSDAVLKSARVVYFEKPKVNREACYFGDTPTAFFTATKPTMGFAPEGSICKTDSGNYTCLFSHTTQLNGAATGTTITVDSLGETTPPGTAQVGDIVGVDLDDETTHWTTISGIAGLVVTLTDTIVSPIGTASPTAIDNARVYFVRWERAGLIDIITNGTATRTLSDADVGAHIRCTTGTTITCPQDSDADIPIGSVIHAEQTTVAALAISAGTGASVIGASATAGTSELARITKIAANTYHCAVI